MLSPRAHTPDSLRALTVKLAPFTAKDKGHCDLDYSSNLNLCMPTMKL